MQPTLAISAIGLSIPCTRILPHLFACITVKVIPLELFIYNPFLVLPECELFKKIDVCIVGLVSNVQYSDSVFL